MHKLCTILNLLYKSNRAVPRVSYKEFYNSTVNSDANYKRVRRCEM